MKYHTILHHTRCIRPHSPEVSNLPTNVCPPDITNKIKSLLGYGSSLGSPRIQNKTLTCAGSLYIHILRGGGGGGGGGWRWDEGRQL